MDKLFDKVKKMIIEHLDVDEAQVTMEASLAGDLKADSLDLVQLVLALEEEFDTTISDEDAEKIETVADIVNYVKGKVDS
ncbi:MAG: hypothetical protein RLZ12_713 [Bacillota bacterium]|jgi:acyl carrier protein